MKLKYYMRGLGLGILLTTLILSISYANKKLTDSEIIARAEKLGMVMEDEIDNNLKEAIKKPSASGKPETTPDISVTPEPTSSISSAPTISITPSVSPEPTIAPTPIITNLPDETAQPKSVTFAIEKGMSSNKVSKRLQEIGLIEDAKDFNEYLIAEDKVSVIQVGTYELPEDCTYEDIINAITKKQ